MTPALSSSVGGGISSNKVKYSRLANSDEGYIDLQFKRSPPKVPYKAIALATFLFLVGSLLIIIGSLLLSGYIHVESSSKVVKISVRIIARGDPGVEQVRAMWIREREKKKIQKIKHTKKNPDRTIPVLIIGVLIFLPGFYHLRIAFYASKGYRGYSYDDIPDFDD